MRTFALIVMALVLGACAKRVELMASMPETDANEVMAALQNAGIVADKAPGKEGMVSLSIEASEVGRAVDLLRTKGLPRERFMGMGQVFKKEGLISSPLEERARYLYAISQELGATLSQIDGVVLARVHVVLPERGGAGDPMLPSSAAVFIKYQEGYNLDVLQPQIRRLVNNSIPGLSPEKISIVLFGSQPLAPRTAGAHQGSASTVITVLSVLAGLVLIALALAGWRFAPQMRAWRAGPTEG